jgi:hypothetical protein
MREHHYQAIARTHESLGERRLMVTAGAGDTLLERRLAEQELDQCQAACPANPLPRQIGKRRRNCNLTRNELKSLYNMRFRHFKIQGRSRVPCPTLASACQVARR